MEIFALHGRGWSVSAIARHTGRDRKTVKAYLAGEGERRGRRVCWSPTASICWRGSWKSQSCHDRKLNSAGHLRAMVTRC